MAATARRTASKSPSSSKSNTDKPSSKSSKAKAKPSRGRTTSARTRKAGPPRQSQPTAERYMEIQQALAEKGFYEGPVDGKWNASCVEALKRFQADQNLAPDGKLGALSLIALGLGPKRDGNQVFLGKPEPVQ